MIIIRLFVKTGFHDNYSVVRNNRFPIVFVRSSDNYPITDDRYAIGFYSPILFDHWSIDRDYRPWFMVVPHSFSKIACSLSLVGRYQRPILTIPEAVAHGVWVLRFRFYLDRILRCELGENKHSSDSKEDIWPIVRAEIRANAEANCCCWVLAPRRDALTRCTTRTIKASEPTLTTCGLVAKWFVGSARFSLSWYAVSWHSSATACGCCSLRARAPERCALNTLPLVSRPEPAPADCSLATGRRAAHRLRVGCNATDRRYPAVSTFTSSIVLESRDHALFRFENRMPPVVGVRTEIWRLEPSYSQIEQFLVRFEHSKGLSRYFQFGTKK